MSLCIVLVTWSLQPFMFHQRQNSHGIYFASWSKIDDIFYMSYLEIFRVLTRVGVDISKLFRIWIGARVLKPVTGAELESEKCDYAHLCFLSRKWMEHVFCKSIKSKLINLLLLNTKGKEKNHACLCHGIYIGIMLHAIGNWCRLLIYFRFWFVFPTGIVHVLIC